MKSRIAERGLPMANRPGTQVNVQDEEKIDLYALLIKLVEKWYLIAIFALIGALMAGVMSYMVLTPKYEATSKIYVLNSKDSAVNLSDLQISTYLTNDYIEVFNLWPVHEMMLLETGLNYNYSTLAGMLKVTNPANTRILEISVTSKDPTEAQTMANAYAAVSREFIATKMDTAMPTLLEEALLPVSPVSPKKQRNVILGFLAGMLLAMAIVIIRFMQDDYIRTTEDIEKYVQIPVLGSVMLQDGPEFSSASRKEKKA